MELFKKQKIFQNFSNCFLNFHKFLNILKENMTLTGYAFPKLSIAKDMVR